MSNEQPEQPAGDRWGDPDAPERVVHLRARADQQRAWVDSAPDGQRDLDQSEFKNVYLTGADVFCLAKYALAGSDGNLDAAEAQVRYGYMSLPPELSSLHLEGAFFWEAHLERATLYKAHLERADLRAARLEGSNLTEAHLERAVLRGAHLEGANLFSARLEGAGLDGARLEGADLRAARLEGANLFRARLEGANLGGAHLEGASLTSATFDKTSNLNDATLTGVSLDRVTFDNVNLTVVDWSLVPVLGDEVTAKNAQDKDGKPKDMATRQREYAAAVRANRVLAVTLRSQGMNEDADHYAYRAQVLQRAVLCRQRKWGRAFGSWLLDAISGYGYKPMRSVWTYVGVILAFAAAYFAITNFAITPFLPTHSTPLAWYEALVLSISSFHGRGLFPTGLSLGDPVAMFAAAEAIIGLLIEITFIATFTQRFFAR